MLTRAVDLGSIWAGKGVTVSAGSLVNTHERSPHGW
ncbi:hypothetical protein [Rhizobium sp. Rhizsp82]